MISRALCCAGLGAALHAAGADLIGQIETFGLLARERRRAAAGAREDLLADLRDQSVQFRWRHETSFQ